MYRIIFLLSIVNHSVFAQDTPTSLSFDSITLVNEFKEYKAAAIYITKTEQLFIQTVENEILKIDTTGNVRLRYTNKYLGTPQFVYIENPLQLVLFYPAFQTIIILDQWMNEIKRVMLSDFRIPFVSTVGLSQDRSIWYYDDQVKRLKKISIDGQKSFESTNFITEENADWNLIQTRKNDLVMQGKSGNIYLLNLFGQLKTKSFVDAKLIGSTYDKFLALNGEKKILISLDQNSLEIKDHISLPDRLYNTISIQLLGNLIYQVDTDGKLKIWKRY